MKNYDIVIIGASVAGCAAAILYAEKGLKVALVEQKININSRYKIMCTHTIQSSALPVIQNLGIFSNIKEQGGVFTHHQIWSKYGWIKRGFSASKFSRENCGINITRKSLDPILLSKTLTSPNVTYFPGYSIQELLCENDIICGKQSALSLENQIVSEKTA